MSEPPPDQPPRGPMRFYVSLPPWFFTATAEERADPSFQERLIAWLREQKLARQQKTKPEDKPSSP